MNIYDHARSSVLQWGGTTEDYIAIHAWFGYGRDDIGDHRYRAIRHHREGIFLLEGVFGRIIKLSTGQTVQTRLIGEQHVMEDLGRIPSAADWCRHIRPQDWMWHSTELAIETDNAGLAMLPCGSAMH